MQENTVRIFADGIKYQIKNKKRHEGLQKSSLTNNVNKYPGLIIDDT